MADHIWKENGSHQPLWNEIKIINREQYLMICQLEESENMLGIDISSADLT